MEKTKASVIILTLAFLVLSSFNISLQPISATSSILDDTNLFEISKVIDYPITLSGVPSGTGYYQQLITISGPSQYGVNSEGSNIQFKATNGTLLYAWIQSINSTSMQVWVKNYFGNSVIGMEVLPASENLLSVTGFLGEAPQLSPTYAEYDNGEMVFPFYADFSSPSLTNNSFTLMSKHIIFSDGLTLWSTNVSGYSGVRTINSLNLSNYVEMAYMNTSYYVSSADTAYMFTGNGSTFIEIQQGPAHEPIPLTLVTFNASTRWIATTGEEPYNASNPTLYSMWQVGSTYYAEFQNSTTSQTISQTRLLNNGNTEFFNNPISFFLWSSSLTNETQHYYWTAVRDYLTNGMPTFTIGAGSQNYEITFVESGLPSGMSWAITIGGARSTSTNSTLTFYEPNGTYSYTVVSIPYYKASIYSGTITVQGSGVRISVSFALVTYSITIVETGLPVGTLWSVTLTGTSSFGLNINVTTETTASSLSFEEPDGTYLYAINLPSGYSSEYKSGGVIVDGFNISVNIPVHAVINYLLIGVIATVVLVIIAIMAVIVRARGVKKQ